MHALLVTVSIDPAHAEEAGEALNSQVVPGVKQFPGLVAGYWLATTPGASALEGFSMVVFDTEDDARKAEEMAKSSPLPPGVAFTGFEIREVVAHT